MAKYLLLKHYRGAPSPVTNVPMSEWEPEEVSAHMQYMRDFASRDHLTRPAARPNAELRA